MKKRKKGRTLQSFVLALAMVFSTLTGIVPGMSLTALADGTTYNPASTYTGYDTLKTNNTVVTINEVANVEWYVIGYSSDAKTVTLLSKTSFGNKAFNSNYSSGNNYASSEIKNFVEGLTGDGQSLAGIKGALANISVTGDPSISGAVPYLLSTTEANALDSTKKGTDTWWLRSPGHDDESAACVYYGIVDDNGYYVHREFAVRPALQLNLESVIFDSESKKFSLRPAGYNVTITAGSNMTKTAESGDASQTGLSGAMTDVVYTANDGYYFPEDYSVAAVNGISVTRNSYTQITVSGTPTADASITLTAPTAKTKETTPTTTFTATGVDVGTISGVTAGMKYSLDGTNWTDISSSTAINLTGLFAGTIKVVKKGNGTTTIDSDPQSITVTKAETPNLTVTQPTVVGGKGTVATTTSHEYSSDNGSTWTTCTANQEFEAGTYLIRVKASGTALASGNQTVTINSIISVTVTFKVVNGSWNEGEGEAATADKTVTLTGNVGDALKLSADQIPAVGNRPSETYKTGSWNTEPTEGTVITQDTTYTYTYEKEDVPVTPGISLNPTEVSVKVGESKTVTATTVPEGQTVIWSSANEEVATVTNGAITGVANGTTTVTAKMTYDSTDYTADVTVTVSEDSVSYDVTFKVVNGNWNNGSSDDKKVTLTGAASETLKLREDQIPSAGSDPYEGYKEGAWDLTPSTETAITENTTYIYTYAKGDEPGPGPEEPGVSLNLSSINVKPGDSATVSATTVPEGLVVAWSSEDESIATVSDGVITGVAEGTTNILASVEIEGTTYTASVSVTVAKKPAPPKPDDPGKKEEEKEEKPHTHHYVWETIEATEESDGELRYACDICGAVQTRVPISAYYVFNKNTAEKIRKAGQGATVYVETSRCISFHKMVMEALAERHDVTLRISFLDEEYKGNRVTVTIPAGTDTLSLVDENGFVGFLYLAGKFGTAN